MADKITVVANECRVSKREASCKVASVVAVGLVPRAPSCSVVDFTCR